MPKSKEVLDSGQEPETKAGKLTPKEEAFCHFYLVHKNGTKAARLAGYAGDEATLAVAAYRLLRKDKIQTQLRALGAPALAAMGIDREWVLAELAIVAKARVSDIFEIKNGSLRIKNRTRARALDGLTGISYTEGQHGDSVSFKFDKLGALEKVGQYVGVFDKGDGKDQGDGSTPADSVLDAISKSEAGRKGK